MRASSQFTRTTQRRKHKHKHKGMELIVPSSCACAYAFVVAAISLFYTYDASIRRSTSRSTRNLRVNWCDASISALCLRLCLCLRRPILYVGRNDASQAQAQEKETISILLCLCLCLCRCVVRVNRDDASTSARKGN